MSKVPFNMRLKEAMKARKCRQIDIVKESEKYTDEYGLKITKADISQYITGKNVPKQGKAEIIAKILNVDMGWLLGYDTDFILEARSSP